MARIQLDDLHEFVVITFVVHLTFVRGTFSNIPPLLVPLADSLTVTPFFDDLKIIQIDGNTY